MSGLGVWLAAAGAMLRRDTIVYLSYRWRLVSQIIGVLFSLGIFYYVSRLVRLGGFASPDDYFAFVAIGIIIVQVLQASLDTPVSLRQELVAGTFERMVISPFGPVASVLSMLAFPVLFSLLNMMLTLLVAAAVFGLALHWSTLILALPVALMGSAAFASIGLVFAAAVVRFKQSVGSAYVLAGVSLVAGFYFPPSVLPWWLRWASQVQPFTPAVDLLRHLLVGQSLRYDAIEDVVKLVGFTAVMLPIGIAIFAAAVRASRRRGTIIEY